MNDTIINAIEQRRLDYIMLLHRKFRYNWLNSSAGFSCCLHGCLEILEYFHRYTPFDKLDIEYLVQFNQMNMIEWAQKKNIRFKWSNEILQSAILSGSVDMLNWVKKNFTVLCTKRCVEYAGSMGLSMVKWLHANYRIVNFAPAIEMAVARDHLDTIQWLYNQGIEKCTTKTLLKAALFDRYNIVKWLFETHTGLFNIAVLQTLSNCSVNMRYMIHNLCMRVKAADRKKRMFKRMAQRHKRPLKWQ
jgi:hypothetical protein